MGKKLEGNGIWEASRMMLPEHKAVIREHRSRLELKGRPQLDEQQVQLLAQLIGEAADSGARVRLTLYEPYGCRVVEGYVRRVDALLKQIKLAAGECRQGGTEKEQLAEEWVRWADVVDVELV